MIQTDKIKQYASALRLTQIKNNPQELIHNAQLENMSYSEFLLKVLSNELKHRQNKDLERRLRTAKLPKDHNLNSYDVNVANGVSIQQLKQLRELTWLEQNYNMILMGPSGTGKTFIAAGLIHDAVNSGYKAYFTTMEDLINVLKLKEMTSSALNTYNRYTKADVIAIDDIMLFPIKKNEAVAFFNLINLLHQRASVIITTNKSPKQWAETLDDEVLATALLDRLLFRCEVLKMEGTSYRMDNRKSIFGDLNNVK